MGSDTPFIDVHCHLLPGLDDGATDLDMSLELIDQGLEDGIGTWVLTPHVLDAFDEETDRRHYAAFEQFREEVSKRALPMKLVMASEIMLQANVPGIRARRTSTFDDNKKYFLIEFPLSFFPANAEQLLFEFQMARMTPIIAHPERNGDLAQHPKTIANMAGRGILMQINARSLHPKAPPPTRRLAETLITSGLAHFVATDAHHPRARPALLREAYERICEIAGEEVGNRLCTENPRAAIEGKRIHALTLDSPERETWWMRLLERLRS
jgi:protein-tyrosine phosphatase